MEEKTNENGDTLENFDNNSQDNQASEEIINFSCFLCQASFNVEIEFKEHLDLHKNVTTINGNSHKESSSEVEEDPVEPEKKNSEEKQSQDTETACNTNQNEKTPQIFMCIYCNEEFDTNEEMDQHIDRIHPNPFDSDLSFSDEEDEEMDYFDLPNIPVLVELHHSPESGLDDDPEKSMASNSSTEKPHECPHCQKRFNHRRDMKNHTFTHFPALPKPHQCSFCSRSFIKKIELTRHLYSHNPETDRPKNFLCNICHKCFTFASDLRKHETIHQSASRERKYSCHLCENKSFYRSEHLKRHILSMHKSEGENLYHSCPLCQKKFISQIFMKKHMHTHEIQ